MSDLQARYYTPDLASDWNAFVARSNEGTIFHRTDFLSYHPAGRFDFHHMLFYHDNRIVGVLPMAWQEEDGQRVALSPAGASFGGLALAPGLGLMRVEEIVRLAVALLRSEGMKKIRITPPPVAYYRTYSSYVPFALLHQGFRLTGREVTCVVHLPPGAEDIDSLLDYSCRKQVRKAIRNGVEGHDSSDYATFYEILFENRQRHGVVPTHTLDELLKLADFCGSQMRMRLAYHQGNAVAGTLYFVCNTQVDLAFYHCHRQEFESLSATHLLVRQEIEWAVRNQLRRIDFGTSTIQMVIQPGGLQFKEGFGAVGDLRDTYEVVLS